jgi:anaerobic dimethyl sulfoxide reductase subunit B (iron-sulfur subunit)
VRKVNDRHFVIDLALCTGCQACSIACKDRAGLPDHLDWLRVEAHEGGIYPNPSLTYRVMHCFHCAEPPCVTACPSDGLVRGEDGWVQLDAASCDACEACIDACPFAVIVLHAEGIVSKCDGCDDEVQRGWDPTCVRACPMRALDYAPLAGALSDNRVKDPEFEDHGIGPAVLFVRRPDGP